MDPSSELFDHPVTYSNNQNARIDNEPAAKKRRRNQPEKTSKRSSYTVQVCDTCRAQKKKCCGTFPCRTCVEKGRVCTYDRPDGRRLVSLKSKLLKIELADGVLLDAVTNHNQGAAAALRDARTVAGGGFVVKNEDVPSSEDGSGEGAPLQWPSTRQLPNHHQLTVLAPQRTGPSDSNSGIVDGSFNLIEAAAPNWGMVTRLAQQYALFHYVEGFGCSEKWIGMIESSAVLRMANNIKEGTLKAPEACFVITAAAALGARGMCHLEVADRLVAEAKSMGNTLFDSYTTSTAIGFVLMSWYHMGNDIARAELCAQVAATQAKHCRPSNPEEKKKIVECALFVSFLADTFSTTKKKQAMMSDSWEALRHAPMWARGFFHLTHIIETCGYVLFYMQKGMLERLGDVDVYGPVELCHMVTSVIADHAWSTSALSTLGDLKVINKGGASLIEDSFGTHHAMLSNEQYSVMEEACLGCLEEAGAAKDEMPAGMYDIFCMMVTSLRMVVHFKSGRFAEATALATMLLTIEEKLPITYSPACHLYTLCGVAEFGVWNRDTVLLRTVSHFIQKLIGVHARAQSAYDTIQHFIEVHGRGSLENLDVLCTKALNIPKKAPFTTRVSSSEISAPSFGAAPGSLRHQSSGGPSFGDPSSLGASVGGSGGESVGVMGRLDEGDVVALFDGVCGGIVQ